MPSQALYRKWRSHTFDDVVAQEHVTHTLANALRSGRVAHAYLFAGPRGTGKTSTARLLAKAVNCTGPEGQRPCNQCPTCLAVEESRLMDLIEIDAASNRGIDEIRDLREKVNFRPTEARYKVYVIDEVHMLTNEAFNALLKTLEEPPPHVIFVLATTEPHKIPATVLSRCQRFDFRRIPREAIVDRLRYIAGQEGVQIDESALEMIARQATGSLRDAVSLLDQLISYGGAKIALEQVQAILGLVPQQMIRQILGALVAGDVPTSLTGLSEAVENGADPYQLSRDMVEYLRGLLLIKMSGGTKLLNLPEDERESMKKQVELLSVNRLVDWIKAFNQAAQEMRLGAHPQLPLELALVSAWSVQETEPKPATAGVGVRDSAVGDARKQTAAPASASIHPAAEAAPAPEKTLAPVQPVEPCPEPVAEPPGLAFAESVTLEEVNARWAAILNEVREHDKPAQAFLRDSLPMAVTEGEVVVGFYYDLHKKHMEDPKKCALVQSAMEKVLGRPLRVKCVVVPRGQAPGSARPGGTTSAQTRGETQSTSSAPERARPTEFDLSGNSNLSGNDDAVENSKRTSAREKYQDAAAKDPVVREAVERFGARVTDVQVINESDD